MDDPGVEEQHLRGPVPAEPPGDLDRDDADAPAVPHVVDPDEIHGPSDCQNQLADIDMHAAPPEFGLSDTSFQGIILRLPGGRVN